jgi:Concanavalin A-like lectin/glucanases superfamily
MVQNSCPSFIKQTSNRTEGLSSPYQLLDPFTMHTLAQLGFACLLLAGFLSNKVTSLPIPLDHYNFTACLTNLQDTTRNETTQVIPISRPLSGSLTGTLVASAESHFQCLRTKGFYSLYNLGQAKDRLETKTTLQRFQEHFRDTVAIAPRHGLSITMWLQPNDISQSVSRAIFTMGITNTTDALLLPCGDPYHLRIAQLGSHFVISFTDDNLLCSTLRVKASELVSDQLTHLAIAFGERSMQVYIDGTPMYPYGALKETVHIPNWTYMNRATVQLFSNYISYDQVFQGKIHQLDLYDVALAEYQVASMYNGGVGFWTTSISNEEGEDDELFQLVPNYDPRPLVASPLVPTILIDQTDTLSYIPIPLKSCNKSNPARQYALQITSTPQYGSLFLLVDETPYNATTTQPIQQSYQALHVNDILALYGSNSEVAVYYRLASADYFNIPTHNGYGSDLHVRPEGLQYRVVELDPMTSLDRSTETFPYIQNSMSELVKVSAIRTVPIYVVHVKADPMHLSLPPDAVTRVNENTVVIRGLDVMDFNLNTDYVRVDVSLPSSSDGSIAINPSYWSLLSSGRAMQQCSIRWYSDWQCSTEDTNSTSFTSSITFIALPSDIPWILNEMKVTTYTSENFSVAIRLHDGIGGDCLYAQEHWTLNNDTNYDMNQWWWASVIATQSNETKRSILDHMYYRNDSCIVLETLVLIPGTDVAHSTNQANDVDQKRSLRILGFEWKEFLFGAVILLVLLCCLYGCCQR